MPLKLRSAVPEPIEDQDVFWDETIHLFGRERAGHIIGLTATIVIVFDLFAAQRFD
jgi:hypothetical protein